MKINVFFNNKSKGDCKDKEEITYEELAKLYKCYIKMVEAANSNQVFLEQITQLLEDKDKPSL